MKVFKELPESIYYSTLLRISSSQRLLQNKKQIPVLVSLTSISSRLPTIDLVIKSLFSQSVLPEKIYLWLPDTLKNTLPKRLSNLESDIFEIKYTPLTCSHKKLIHTLEENPTKNIVTCDDDVMYRKNWLESLYQEHLKYPQNVIANRAKQIKFDEKRDYLLYKKWDEIESETEENRLLGIGAWGIFYPPKALNSKVFDRELFLKLTPKADDLWFKGMSLMQGTKVRQNSNPPKNPIPIIGTQKIALKRGNVNEGKNDTQWQNLSDYFGLDEILLK